MTCPLANSNYATILPKKGKLYLHIKTAERSHLPSKMWEVIELSQNYQKALEQIDELLPYWKPIQIHRCKQRLGKLTEMIRRMRKLRLKEAESSERIDVIKKKTERRDLKRMQKSENRANIQNEIENELLERIKIGTYGDLYEGLKEEKLKKQLEMEDEAMGDIEEFIIENIDSEDLLEEEDEEISKDSKKIKKKISLAYEPTKIKKIKNYN